MKRQKEKEERQSGIKEAKISREKYRAKT